MIPENPDELTPEPSIETELDLTRMSQLRPLLARHGVALSKRFGQNFLVSRPHLLKVVDSAQIGPNDDLFEIGPGVGVLTVELAKRARRVVAVELDRGLLPVLSETLASFPNVHVVHADALKLDLPAFLAEHFPHPTGLLRVAANIPYNITSPILVQLLSTETMPRRFASLSLMVQREVARRVCALPGSDEYGALSVFVQYHATPRLAVPVPRGAFFPPPKVDSAVLQLVPHEIPPVDVESKAAFFLVSRAAFGQRRKTLANALTNAPTLQFARDEIALILDEAEIDGQRRGETLTLAEIARIANRLAARPGGGAVDNAIASVIDLEHAHS